MIPYLQYLQGIENVAEGGDGGPPPEVVGGVAVEGVFGSVEVERGEILRQETLETQEDLKWKETLKASETATQP